eukprot:111199-Rhodomonas_salina.1
MQQLCGQCSRLSVVMHDEQGQRLGLAATSGGNGQNNHRSGNNGQAGATKTNKKGNDGLLSPQKAATSGVNGQNNHRSGNNGQAGATTTSKKGNGGLLSPQKAATSSKATSGPQKGNTPTVDPDDYVDPDWYNGWGYQWHMERYGHIKKLYPDGKRTLHTKI